MAIKVIIFIKSVLQNTFLCRVDKKYQSQGKLGAALLSGKSVEDGPYQLLLYRGKQQQVCVSRILRDTNFLVST